MLTPINTEDLTQVEKERHLDFLKQSSYKSEEDHVNHIEYEQKKIKLAEEEPEALQFSYLVSQSFGLSHDDDASPHLRETDAGQLRHRLSTIKESPREED